MSRSNLCRATLVLLLLILPTILKSIPQEKKTPKTIHPVHPPQKVNSIELSVLWTFNTNSPIWSSPALYDLDLDEDMDVVFANNDGLIFAIDCITGEELWHFDAGSAIKTSPSIGDIDDDDKPEIIFSCDSGRVYALNGENGSVLVFRHQHI